MTDGLSINYARIV